MIDNNQNENNNMPSTDSTFQNNESSLSELRNIIVGSFAHKGYYLQNGVYQQLLSSYLNSQNNIPILNLQISIIDSYIILLLFVLIQLYLHGLRANVFVKYSKIH